MGQPITVAIERHVDPARITEATIWTQAGTDLAGRRPGYLGSGFVRAGPDSDLWYMLYRFADSDSLTAWEDSAERRWWLESGRDFATTGRVERRTGIEGWFDAPYATLMAESPAAPPRWKQSVSIWLGFYPTNLAFTALLSVLVPSVLTLPLPLRLLITTVVVTPIMTYLVLPFVTARLAGWLHRPRH